jgi:hypothetical protein
MSKIIDSLVQSSIDSKEYVGIILCQMHFDPIVRVCNSPQSIYWDEAGAGEVEYVGVGNLGSVSSLTETNELGATVIQLTLSGIPNSSITDVFSNEYRGKPIYIWYAVLDKTTYAVEGGQSGPILTFAGLMDYSSIEFGNTAVITLSATSRLADWDRSRGGRFTDGYQRQYIDPTDTGFRWVVPIQTKAISWGGVSIGDPGGGLEGAPGGGPGTNPTDEQKH